jgi:hypothetical protein
MGPSVKGLPHFFQLKYHSRALRSLEGDHIESSNDTPGQVTNCGFYSSRVAVEESCSGGDVGVVYKALSPSNYRGAHHPSCIHCRFLGGLIGRHKMPKLDLGGDDTKGSVYRQRFTELPVRSTKDCFIQ